MKYTRNYPEKLIFYQFANTTLHWNITTNSTYNVETSITTRVINPQHMGKLHVDDKFLGDCNNGNYFPTSLAKLVIQ